MTAPIWVSMIFCPLLGLILANIMWLSPMSAMLKARKERNLGSINPYPFVFTILNCIGWSIYAIFTFDILLFFANLPGTLLGLFYTINSLTILAQQTVAGQDFSPLYLGVESFLLFVTGFWCFIGLLTGVAFGQSSDPKHEATQLVGYLSVAFSISYYAAPLSTMFQVIATRNASSLYFPTILVNLINAVCWTSYGLFGQNDVLLYGPNGLGVILAVSQIAMIMVYTKLPLKDLLMGKSESSPQSIEGGGGKGEGEREDDGDDEGDLEQPKMVKKDSVRLKGHNDEDDEDLLAELQDPSVSNPLLLTHKAAVSSNSRKDIMKQTKRTIIIGGIGS